MNTLILLASSILLLTDPLVPPVPGTYPVTIAITDDESVETTIYISVYLPTTDVYEVNQIAIDASDFTISYEDFLQITDAKILELSKAYAWNVGSGEELPTSILKRTKITDSNYLITIGTSLNLEKDINMYILPSNNLLSLDKTLEYTSVDLNTVDNTPFFTMRYFLFTLIVWLLLPLLILGIIVYYLRNSNKKIHNLLYRNY